MIVWSLTPDEIAALAAELNRKPSVVRVAFDPIDNSVKFRTFGAWSPPMGKVVENVR